MNYLPFQPIKNKAFRLYFSVVDYTSANFPPNIGTWEYVGISKDGATFDATTNTPVQITGDSADGQSGNSTRAKYYVDLTADEMNADVVVFQANDSASQQAPAVIVMYTIPQELSSAPSKTSSVAEKVTAIFQYLFFKRTVTASAETLFKDDGSTSLGSNTLSDNGTTVTKGKIS